MGVASDVIEMPIASAVRRAAAQADAAEIARLIAASPVEAWYAIPPDELRQILNTVPERDFDPSSLAFAFKTVLNPDAAATHPPANPGAGFMVAMMTRLRGAPCEAAGLIDGALDDGVVHPLFDRAGGMTTFVLLHKGFTYMLAGRIPEARDGLAAATVTPPPAALTMLLRDAYAKSAVIDALFGSHADARRSIDLAAGLPLTTSWAEPIVTSHLTIAEALLASEGDVDAALARLERLPSFVVGEMWPFWLLAVFVLHMRVGTPEEGVAQVERLSAGTPAATAVDGFPASILPFVRAVSALLSGDGLELRTSLAAADDALMPVRLLNAAIAVQREASEGLIAALVGLRGDLHSFEQMDALRIAALAWAMLRTGDESAAATLLTDLAKRRERSGTPLMLVPAAVDEFGRARIEGWQSPKALIPEKASEPHMLSKRERKVLKLLASDRTREQIAEDLFVSVNTIKSQLTSIFRKLGVDNRLDAVLEAERRRLL